MPVSPDSIVSGLTGKEVNQVVQYCVCLLLNHFTFLSFFWGHRAAWFARANTGTYCNIVCWWLFSARSGKNVGAVARMHQQNFTTQPRHWLAISSPEYRGLTRIVMNNCFFSGCRLRVEMIRRFRRGLLIQSIVNWFIAAGYGLGVPPGVPDWLWITGGAAVCEAEHTESRT